MKNIALSLQEAYKKIPDQAAIRLLQSRKEDENITYQGLWLNSTRYAQILSGAGIQPGEVVILILQHSADLIYAFFGAILYGAIPSIMPFLTEKLLPEQYRSSLSALFEITAPTAVITYQDFLEEVRSASKGTSVRAVLSVEACSPSLDNNSEESVKKSLAGLTCSPEEVVLLQHSSGTTGLQKGVALSHQAVFNQLESYTEALRLKPDDVVVSWLPLYHDMGLIAGFILPILSRIPLVLMSPFEWVRAPYRLLQAITTYKGTLCWMPNFAYNFCAQKIRDRDLENIDLSSLRALINCSEPMHWKSHTMFLERFKDYGFKSEALATCYAMAENVFAVTQGGIDKPATIDIIDQQQLLNHQLAEPVSIQLPRDDSAPDQLHDPVNGIIQMISAGHAIKGTSIRIIDANGNDLPERHIGHIILQSGCMLTSYYRRKDLTEKAFHKGWYLTGDLGYIAQGELYVTGRQKDLIIVGGKNIYPQDLERLVNEIDGVYPGRVVAFGVFNEQNGTEDVVIVAEADFEIPEEGQSTTPQVQRRIDQISDEIRRRVTRGSDVALRYVKLVNRNWLVKTSSGKVARAANRTKFLSESRQGN